MKPLLGLIIQPRMFAEEHTVDEIEGFFRDIMQTLMYAMDNEVNLQTFESQVAIVILKYKK